jgi:hypothetical protein
MDRYAANAAVLRTEAMIVNGAQTLCDSCCVLAPEADERLRT